MQRKRGAVVGTFRSDLQYGLRMLAAKPGFTIVAVSTLALGIGANLVMFSIVNGVLLKPMPYDEADQIVRIHTQWRDFGFGSLNPHEYFDILEGTRSFQDVGLYRHAGVNLFEGEGEPEHISAVRITPSVLEALRIQPARGRPLQSEEAFLADSRVALMSDRLWKRRFGEDPQIIGRKLQILSGVYEVIGVMPSDFKFPSSEVDLWIGYGIDRANMGHRGGHSSSIVARLKDEVPIEKAQVDLDQLSARLRQEYAENYPEATGFRFFAQPYLEHVAGSVRPALLVLMAAVGFVLLIACANIANLLLARIMGRGKEIAIRISLGATPRRVLAQIMTESFLLSLLGGLGALAVAFVAFRSLPLLDSESIPRLSEVAVDGTVVVFSIGLLGFVTPAVGLIPALQFSRGAPLKKLGAGGRQGGGAMRYRARAALVVAEVALATVLLVGAGLLIRSFQGLLAVDPGFRPENVLMTRITLPRDSYPDQEKRALFFEQLMARLGAQPGVISAAAVNILPVSGSNSDWSIAAEGYTPPNPDVPDFIQYRIVTPDYFKTIGIPLLKGRFFTHHDGRDGQPVTIISQSLARKFWGDEDAIGKRIRPGGLNSSSPWHTVVGVVGDVYHSGAREGEIPIWYRSVYQHNWSAMSLAVKTTGDPAGGLRQIKDALGQVDSRLPIHGTQVMTRMVADSLSQERFNTKLLAVFAGLALALAAIGIFGVISYSVGQRTREIGIRMALGARKRQVYGQLLDEGFRLIGLGLVLGILAALVLTSLLQSLLFGVESYDPTTYIVIVAVLCGAGLLACLAPARRATRVDPIVALRCD